jgi:hypothetical protein
MKKADIRNAIKRLFPTTTMIEVGFREVQADGEARRTSCNALDWASDADLFETYSLTHVGIPRADVVVLDCWLYEGRGAWRELNDHATVTIQADMIFVTDKHWNPVVRELRDARALVTRRDRQAVSR